MQNEWYISTLLFHLGYPGLALSAAGSTWDSPALLWRQVPSSEAEREQMWARAQLDIPRPAAPLLQKQIWHSLLGTGERGWKQRAKKGQEDWIVERWVVNGCCAPHENRWISFFSLWVHHVLLNSCVFVDNKTVFRATYPAQSQLHSVMCVSALGGRLR